MQFMHSVILNNANTNTNTNTNTKTYTNTNTVDRGNVVKKRLHVDHPLSLLPLHTITPKLLPPHKTFATPFFNFFVLKYHIGTSFSTF